MNKVLKDAMVKKSYRSSGRKNKCVCTGSTEIYEKFDKIHIINMSAKTPDWTELHLFGLSLFG